MGLASALVCQTGAKRDLMAVLTRCRSGCQTLNYKEAFLAALTWTNSNPDSILSYYLTQLIPFEVYRKPYDLLTFFPLCPPLLITTGLLQITTTHLLGKVGRARLQPYPPCLLASGLPRLLTASRSSVRRIGRRECSQLHPPQFQLTR